MDIIKVNNLNLYYGTMQALKKVNMNIKKNKVTALIGPSGCGKSTFLRTLNRMNDLIEGVKIQGDISYNNIAAESSNSRIFNLYLTILNE